MAKERVIYAADLFCGAGGTSTGLALACRQLGVEIDLLAINHWDTAIETHRTNHPWARHLHSRLQDVDPKKVVPSGRLHLLVASPECTHHSRARGGRPVNDQLRASGWLVLKWLQELYVENVLIENVTEFREWGPLGADGRPLKGQKGETYRAFLNAIRSLGYRVEEGVLNAADYGDATTRERLFILGRRPAHKRIEWPVPTHSREKTKGLFGTLKPWRPAKDIIDWSLPGESIFRRKRPLSAKTLARIEAGLRKFGGKAAEPFLVLLRGTSKTRSVKLPLPTITAGGGHVGVVQPFLLAIDHHGGNGQQVRDVKDPVAAITTKARIALCEPFILSHRTFKNEAVDSIHRPLRTLVGTGRDIKVVQPFVISAGGPEGQGRKPKSVGEPLSTVLTENRSSLRSRYGGVGRALVQPFIVEVGHGGADSHRAHSAEAPLGTVTAVNHYGVVDPHLIKFYKDAKTQNQPVTRPLDTITTRDRFGLVHPLLGEGKDGTRYAIDILFRMLRPGELAAAMGFGRDYRFSGTQSAQVRQIGNAVPVKLAMNLCLSLLSEVAARMEAGGKETKEQDAKQAA
ncbi:MAG: DNA cytosine methyltransferase [Nitrospirae bacterium]|nr:DNA cytosine methyltransferase [Nitrospirota bacterium]